MNDATQDTLIRLDNVSIVSENFEILRDVSLSIPRGKSTVIIGPSGCGKSTLLKVAAGISIPEQGSLRIGGKNFLRYTEKQVRLFRRDNGFVFQDAALWENRSLYENLSIPLEFHYPDRTQDERNRRVRSLLEKTGLSSEAQLRPAQISTGERKIVSFLRALVNEPTLLFMDEPTLSIDREKAAIIYDMIRDLKRRNCTLVTVTHDPRLTSWLADYVIVLKQGRLVMEGPFDAVKASPEAEVQAILRSVLEEAATYDTDILGLLNDE